MKRLSGLLLLFLIVLFGRPAAFAEETPETIFWHDRIQWGTSQDQVKQILTADPTLVFSCFLIPPMFLPEAAGCLVASTRSAPSGQEQAEQTVLTFYKDRFFRYERRFPNQRFSPLYDLAAHKLGRPTRNVETAAEGYRGRYVVRVKIWDQVDIFALLTSHMPRVDVSQGKMVVTHFPIANEIPDQYWDPHKRQLRAWPQLIMPRHDLVRPPPPSGTDQAQE